MSIRRSIQDASDVEPEDESQACFGPQRRPRQLVLTLNPIPGLIPRRIKVDQMTPAELAILAAQHAVEEAGASVHLTRAANLLSEARNAVADFVDGVNQ